MARSIYSLSIIYSPLSIMDKPIPSARTWCFTLCVKCATIIIDLFDTGFIYSII